MQLLNNRYAILRTNRCEFGKIYLCQDTKSEEQEIVNIQEFVGDYDAKASELIEYDYYLVMGMERPIKPKGFFVEENRYFLLCNILRANNDELPQHRKFITCCTRLFISQQLREKIPYQQR